MPNTYVDILEQRAAEHGERLAFRFLDEGSLDGASRRWTYAELAARARRVATALGPHAGERALLLYPPGLDFIAAFFGCLYAGVVAVPAFPPDPGRLERTLPRLRRITADAAPVVVLTLDAIRQLAEPLGAMAPELGALPWLATDALEEEDWTRPEISESDLAFLQYTSGSTGDPKGVMLTHANLMHNSAVIRDAFAHVEGFRSVGWLPLFHDMGLIGHVLNPVLMGGAALLLSPLDFLRRPALWLEAVSAFQPWTSGGPNFSYALATRKVSDAALAQLDLSSWSVAYSGAEQVRPETMRAFARRFAPAGFREDALLPCYGLAEATLMSTCAPRGPLRTLAVDAAALAEGRARPPAGKVTELASVGVPLVGQQIVVVDPSTGEKLPEGQLGEIRVRGGSVAQGYWGREAWSEEVFRSQTTDGDGPWLRTRDQGMLVDGALYVTGRLDDVMLVQGRNVFPDDVEQAAEASHGAIGGGRSAAFAVEREGSQAVVLVCEVRPSEDPSAVVAAVRAEVMARVEVSLAAVGLLPRGHLPKTSSGKRRRGATRAAWLAGELALWHVSEAAPSTPSEGPLPTTAEGMVRLLQEELSAHLALPVGQIDPERPFAELGLDSVGLVALSERLSARLGRPLHATVLFNIPTLSQLSAWLVDGDAAQQGSPGAALYPDLERALGRLERRDPETYRFDLETGIDWPRVDEPGLYVPHDMLEAFGVQAAAIEAHPEAWRALQVASAMTLCAAFEVTEVTIAMFLDTRRTALGATRTVDRFHEEELKHIELFRRYNNLLVERHPDIAAEVRWDPAWGGGFWGLFRHPERFSDERQYHYLLWSAIVAVEEHSTWFAQGLRDRPQVQPAWRSAHEAHYREERQHVANDAAYLRALELEPAEKERWSEIVAGWIGHHYDTFFGFGPARRLVARRWPALAPHLDTAPMARSGFMEDLLSGGSFRQTRRACPYLRELANLPAEERPSGEALAGRLPRRWLGEGVPLAPRAVTP